MLKSVAECGGLVVVEGRIGLIGSALYLHAKSDVDVLFTKQKSTVHSHANFNFMPACKAGKRTALMLPFQSISGGFSQACLQVKILSSSISLLVTGELGKKVQKVNEAATGAGFDYLHFFQET